MDPGGVMLSVCMFALGCIIAAIPVIKLIGWWMEGGIEGIQAMIGVSLYGALTVAAVTAPATWKFAVIILMVISAVLMPVLGQVSETRGNASIEEERYQSYARALEQNPMNPAARMALAESLYKRGDKAQAFEHMEWTLKQFPGLKTRIQPQLDAWRREETWDHSAKPIICHMCYAENMPGATYCASCGAEFGTKTAIKQRIAFEGGPKMVVRGWITVASVFIFSFALLLYMPAIIAGPIICGLVIVGGWLFLRWIGGDMGTIGD